MQKRMFSTPIAIMVLLFVQFIPLVLFPAESFSPKSQEWWLPGLLVVMVIYADFELIIRRSASTGPWDLISFAHGFNIISRLMMLWAHVTQTSGGVTQINVPYTSLAIVAMLLSAMYLVYTGRPDIRNGLLRS
jgi:hypothetical protein